MPQKVLVVEDEVLIRWDICDQLSAHHIDVLEASTVAEALRLFEQNPDIGVLFTDVQLHGAETGLDLARYVHLQYPQVKILVTSGHVNERSLPREFGELLVKPYSSDDVARKISGWIGSA